MKMVAMRSETLRSSLQISRPARACVSRRAAKLRVLSQAPQSPQSEPSTSSRPDAPLGVGLSDVAVASTSQLPLFGTYQEIINGRSAMLGFVAAVMSEGITHHGVWSQIAGRYVNQELVEAPVGNATLFYFAVVVMVTVASVMPKLIEDLEVDSRSFGPFTPGLESLLGRAAMLGFSGLMVVEAVKNSSLL